MRFLNPRNWRLINLTEKVADKSITSGAGTVELTEVCFSSDADGCRLDKEKGVFFNAKIRGRVSENGREYGPQCDDDGVRLYEGAEINIDHPPTGKESMSRTFTEGWAVARNITKDPAGGNRGDVHFLKSHPITEQVIERYEKGFPLGLSHNAVGKIGKRNGRTFVEGLQVVRSIDLVRRPATTKSLNESVEHEQVSLGEVVKALAGDKSAAFKLLEAFAQSPQMAATPVNYPAADPAAAAGQQSNQALKAALKAALNALFDDDSLTVDEVLDLIRDKVSGKESSSDPEKGGPMEKDKKQKPLKEAIDALTEHVKSDDALSAHVKSLAEAIKEPETDPAEKTAMQSLTEKVDAQATELAAMKKQQGVRAFMDANKLTPASLGPERVKLLEACADDAAMKTLLGTWPASVKNVAPPRGVLGNVAESKGAPQLKTAGDVLRVLQS